MILLTGRRPWLLPGASKRPSQFFLRARNQFDPAEVEDLQALDPAPASNAPEGPRRRARTPCPSKMMVALLTRIEG